MSAEVAAASRHRIGLQNEKPLHAALKRWYARPGDRFEVPVDGYQVDIVRRRRLIEIQTKSFAAIRRKLAVLLEGHSVRLVYPIPRDKWVVRLADDGDRRLSSRRSPKHGGWVDVFHELVSFPGLMTAGGFSLELLLIEEEELRRHDPRRGWRRKGWVVEERRLVAVVDRLLLTKPADVAGLLPASLPEPFSVTDLAAAIGRRRDLAGRMAYCLREMGCLSVAGKQGKAFLYVRTDSVRRSRTRKQHG